MKIARLFGGFAALCAVVGAGVVFAGAPARSFDFQDSPTTIKHPQADITDTYFFPSPTNSANIVVVMDVYPLIPAGQGLTTYFDQKTLYTMKFDTLYGQESATTAGARPIENEVIQFAFGTPTNGTQSVFVYGPATPGQVGTATKLVQTGLYSGAGFINRPFIATSTFFGTSQFSVFAGARRDPQFFNASQFLSIFPDRNMGSTAQTCLPSGANTCPAGFTNGGDFFAGTNVLSIAIEIPKDQLTAGNGGVVAYWATTSTATGQ